MTDALTTAIRLLTTLDHLRGEVARTVTALEPLAEVHPYVGNPPGPAPCRPRPPGGSVSRPRLIIDPAIQFGQPCVPGTRVPFTSLAGGVLAGDSVETTMWAYEVSRADVLVSCFHAVHDAATRPPSYRTALERRYVEAWGAWFDGLPWPYDFTTMPDPPAEDRP